MPAPLPPNSAYTYAIELGADEAIAKLGGKDVLLSQPVFFYVHNFLNFPVGIPVPTGYYDNSRGVWVASDSGRIIKILSITGGLADLDTDGDGLADNGVALGITEAERAQLASRYAVGASLWRVPVSHLSTWDCNWPFSPPPDAQPPQGPPPQPDPQPNKLDCKAGSIVGCQNQTLGEGLPVAGTPFSLHYQSDRAPGRAAAYSVDISLSGSNVPASLTRIDLEVRVAGRLFTQAFPPTPNQRTTVTWDGLDVYGRRVQGQSPATVRIGYVYNGVYQQTSRFGYWGNGIPITGSMARQEVALWRSDTILIGGWGAPGQGLGGWTLSAHHAYDPVGRVLYLGDGSRRSANGINLSTITTVAGTGDWGCSGDGGPATGADLGLPEGVAVAPDGSVYIADTGNDRIRRVGPDGIITTVAGTGNYGFSGDGGQATQAMLNYPSGVAVGPDGSLYIADSDNYRIRRIGSDGVITTVAGTGDWGSTGDGGPATQAELAYPSGVAASPDGSLYIADQLNDRIRRVGPDGIITTVAGTGIYGFSGDGGPATQATLDLPAGVAVAPDGSLYIADYGNSRVRRVGPDGIITTVAGGGVTGLGDGGPATGADLNWPYSVAVAPDGSLYIADSDNFRVRRVGSDGVITTVAGTGDWGFSGDGGPATGAELSWPYSVAVAPDGSLYIADSDWNSRIRRIGPALPGFSAADVAIPSEDGRELYQFYANGRHLRTLHALTAATLYTFTYDSDGRLTQVTDGDGNVTTIQRDGSGNPTAIVAPFGQQTTLALDSNGFLSRVTDPAGASTQLTSSSDGLLATLTDPKGNLHQFTYDSLGRLINDQDPAAGFLALSRTEDLPARTYSVAVTSALSRTSTFQVQQLSIGDERRVNTDPAGLQRVLLIKTDGREQTTTPDGMTATRTDTGDPRWGMMAPVPTSLTIVTPGSLTLTSTSTRTATLSDSNNPLSLTALDDTLVLNGRTSTSHFDAATRTLTTTSPAGRVRTRTIDLQGRTISSQVTGLAPVTATYDAVGRLATITTGTGPDARTTTLAYDSQSYLHSITDPLGHITSFTYDAVGRPLTQTLPDGRVIQTTYDANGNVASLTPPSRPAHTFDYTPVDLEDTYSPPDLGIGNVATTYSYNADRQLTQVMRPDGQTVDLNYDAGGRLSALVTPTGTLQYAYSATTGNLASITAPSSTLAHSYDGSLLPGTTWSGPVAGSVTRTFDTDFRVASQSVNGANTVAFTYDADSLLTGAGSLTLTRNASNGLLTGTTLGVVTDARTYSTFGGLSTYTATVSGSPVFSTTYTRDKLGRITQKVETIGVVTTTFDYDYDLAGRLTQVKENSVVTASYTCGSNGNRLTGPGLGSSPIYDDQDRLIQYGPNTYAYTANGELATKTVGSNTTTYTYDELGNLTRVALPGDTQIDYLIDGQNRRIGKKVGGVLTQGYLYDGILRVVAELDGAGSLVSRFVYGSRLNVPDYMIKGGVTYRIISDHLGSPRLVVDVVTGAAAQQLDYDEFGNVLTDTNPGFQPFGFAGGLYDGDTGLVRFGARDYDPETGRWTTKDPIRFRGGDVNLYGYVLGDPVNRVDPWGLFEVIYPPRAGQLPDSRTQNAMQCFADCLQRNITVTGAREGGHSPGSAHGTGQACDVGERSNPGLDRNDVARCFNECSGPTGFVWGQQEANPPHYHFQTRPGRGGASGFAPDVR